MVFFYGFINFLLFSAGKAVPENDKEAVITVKDDLKSLEYEVVTIFVRGDRNLKAEIPLEN